MPSSSGCVMCVLRRPDTRRPGAFGVPHAKRGHALSVCCPRRRKARLLSLAAPYRWQQGVQRSVEWMRQGHGFRS